MGLVEEWNRSEIESPVDIGSRCESFDVKVGWTDGRNRITRLGDEEEEDSIWYFFCFLRELFPLPSLRIQCLIWAVNE